MKPIIWDGRERTADRLMDIMPGLTISTSGGARGFPRDLWIHTRRGKKLREVLRGQRVGKDARGNPCVIG